MSFDIPTSQVTEGRFRFEIGLAAASAPAYVALGLSFDDEMGEDSVMACTLFGDSVDVAMYWNVASPYNSLPLANAHFGLAEVAGGVTDGLLMCSFERDAKTQVPKPDGTTREFDLAQAQFYLLLATGSLDGNGRLVQHAATERSAGPQVL